MVSPVGGGTAATAAPEGAPVRPWGSLHRGAVVAGELRDALPERPHERGGVVRVVQVPPLAGQSPLEVRRGCVRTGPALDPVPAVVLAGEAGQAEEEVPRLHV